MLYHTLHHPIPRLLAAIVGELIVALALNLFITPLGFYTGGTMGFCQLAWTLLQSRFALPAGPYDAAGILYFLINIPILLYAARRLGRNMILKTVVCTLAFSLFYSLIPTPAAPVTDAGIA